MRFQKQDSFEDRDQDHPDPCECWYFRDVTTVRGVKADDSSYEDGGFEESKTTTVTRMATPRGSVPVALLKRGGLGVGGYHGGSWRTQNREQKMENC